MINKLSKYGLTGDCGFISPNIHVNANYDCNGMVFVETDDYWERMPKKEAKKKGLKIIKCSYCDKPAVSLDHSWPYLQDETTCKKHYNNH